jgi:HSP20 family molecular chaperone IbpA
MHNNSDLDKQFNEFFGNDMDMDYNWKKLMGDFIGNPYPYKYSGPLTGVKGGIGILDVDIDSNDTGCKIVVNLPGMNKDNTKIEIKDLKMKIEVDLDTQSTQKKVTLDLSDKLNLKKINSACIDGILTISIPIKKVNIIQVEIG